MNIVLSSREKVLIFITSLFLIFFVYWYAALNPLLKSIDRTSADIKGFQNQLQRLKAGSPAQFQKTAISKISIFSYEEQLSLILKFIKNKFSWFGIELISLRPIAEGNKLAVQVKFASSYYQFLGFLNSLHQLDTVLVIDNINIDISRTDNRLVVDMRLLSGYL